MVLDTLIMNGAITSDTGDYFTWIQCLATVGLSKEEESELNCTKTKCVVSVTITIHSTKQASEHPYSHTSPTLYPAANNELCTSTNNTPCFEPLPSHSHHLVIWAYSSLPFQPKDKRHQDDCWSTHKNWKTSTELCTTSLCFGFPQKEREGGRGGGGYR